MMRLQTRQGRQVVRQEGVAEGREVHGGHRVQRRQRLVAQQRARAALRQPRQQHRQELAHELATEYCL